MTSRERVLAAINHKQPDKIPFDLGATTVSTVHVKGIEMLNEYYGLPYEPVKSWGLGFMTGFLSNELVEKIGSDAVAAYNRSAAFGLRREPMKIWKTPYGQDIYVPEGFQVSPDGKGGWYAHPQGDLNCKPCAHMPSKSPYFDCVEPEERYDEDNMDPRDNMAEFGVMSDEDIAYVVERVKEAHATGRCVVYTGIGGSLGDASAISGPSLKNPKGIRHLDDWYMAHILYPEYIKEVYEVQSDIAVKNMEKVYAACGDMIDICFICGTDVAHQNGQFLSAEQYADIYLPYHKKMNDWAHKNTHWKTMKHCCGSVAPLIPKFIEAGFDILNPIQTTAVNMEPEMLKREFGSDITFWGGGVDTQTVLPFGTPEEVRKQVLERCEIFGKDGGFVFNPIHIVQKDVPLENIIAMINAVKEFNGDL